MRVTEDDAIRVCECMGYKLTQKNITMIHTALQCYFVIANTSPVNTREHNVINLTNSNTNNSNMKPKQKQIRRTPQLSPGKRSALNSDTNRFMLHDTLGDGDCLFHAFINAYRTTIEGKEPRSNNRNAVIDMRQKIFENLARNNKKINFWIGSNNKEEMMARVLTCGEYGGHAEIVALSHIFKVNIAVIHEKHLRRKSKPYTEDELKQIHKKNNSRMPGFTSGEYRNTVYLGYRGDLKSKNGGDSAHFTAIVKV